MLYSNQEKLTVKLMKKKDLLLLILLVFTLIPAFAAIDYGIYEGNKLQLLTAPMVVRDDCQDNRNHTSAVATLPVGTEITVKNLNNDWAYIEWYSKANNKYKNAWASTTALCVSTGACGIEATMGRYGGQLHEMNYINIAYDLLNNKEHSLAIEKATTGLNAIFSVTSLKNNSSITDINEKLAFGFLVRGAAYSGLKDYHQAIKDLTESMKYKVLNTAHAMRGLNYEQLGYYSKAKADYLKAKQIALAESNEQSVIFLNERIKFLDLQIQKAK
jgi:tetratricopeptide (TPR) repeat protein